MYITLHGAKISKTEQQEESSDIKTEKKPMSASLAVVTSNVQAHVLSMLQRLTKSENVMMMI